ncbi:MAG: hypothetical protein SFU56_22535 [Capsulimonadales bacterium]|nr:hypothetical protein [Capsulimonadales bacterium]
MPTNETVLKALADLLTENFEGPHDPPGPFFTDTEAGTGLFGVLERLSAEQASVTPGADEARRGATVAAHAEHLRWSLALMNAWMRDEQPEHDWEDSWSITTVDPVAWDTLRNALRDEYRRIRERIAAQTELPDFYVAGSFGFVAHMAYHFGAIRQYVLLIAG